MKKFLQLITILLLTWSTSHAQILAPNQPEQDACDALMLCGNSFTSTYSYQLIGQVNDLTSTPCSGGEGNSMWLRLEVISSGIIVFTITPLNGTDDYDFAVLDITNATCSTFTSANVIRCNFNNNQPGSNIGGVVGLNTSSSTLFTTAGATGGSFLQQINATAGDVYLIMINNFGDPFVGGPSSGFTIDFTGSTAIFNDNGRPHMLSAYQPCGINNKIFIPLREKVLCSSIEPTGSDFLLSGGGTITGAVGTSCSGTNGYADTVVLTLASPLAPGAYTIDIQNGLDGNTIIDVCNHADTIPDQIPFVVNPSALSFKEIIPPACFQFKIVTNALAACNSIAPDGSDFHIVGPQMVNVIAAVPVNCNALGLVDTILLTLSVPISVDGSYQLLSKIGNDGNTLLDNCGLTLPVGDSLNFLIQSYDGLVATMPDTVICNPGYLLMTGIDNTSQPSSYNWSPGIYVNDSTQIQTVSFINQTTSFTLLATDKDGCPHRDSLLVTLSERQSTLMPNEVSICKGESITLYASGGNSYSWISGELSALSCTDCPSPIAVPTDTTLFAVGISDQYNCTDTLTSKVNVIPLPQLYSTPKDTSVAYGTELQLTSSGAVYYTWYPATDLNNSTLPTPIATIKDTTYFVVTGIDKNGCRSNDTIQVNVIYDNVIIIPTAFSPNGDGRNDRFKPGNLAYKKLQEFRVFNRWGQEVFSTTDPKDGWDGSFKGQQQDIGTYYYVIRVVTPDNKQRFFKGDVTLIR